jgi:hypothetical protein
MQSEPTVCVLCVAQFPHDETELCTAAPTEIEAAIKEAVIGRPPKEGNEMADPESTGRKRAAAALPTEILETMLCEWALLKEAGGGVYPIKGCHGNKATDRHHGPDKNTLNNQRHSNLHGICAFCHNEWHAKNDTTYVGERPADETPWLPVGEYKEHNPNDKMTIEEAIAEELKRGRYARK